MVFARKQQRLKKELGLLNVYAIATGATLSAGFFLLPGIAVIGAGPAIVLAYVLAAVPLIPAMFSVMELGTAMPRAGGAYYFLDRSMGPLVGTIGGLGTWLVLMLKTAFALVAMGAYVNLVFPQLDPMTLALLFTFLFGMVNVFGAKGAGLFQVILVIGLLSILGCFIGGGLPQVKMTRFDHFLASGWDSIFATAGMVYISYVGITKVASVSEEIKDPEKNLPKGICLALLTAIVIYVLGTFIMVGVVGVEGLRGNYTPVATTADVLLGSWGVWLITAAAICAFSSVVNAGILSASRYPLAMSRDHLLPLFFRKLNRRNLPVSGVVVSVVLIGGGLVFFDPAKIAKLASAFQLLVFAILCFAVIVMRESQIESYDPGCRSPFYPWMQIIGIVIPVWLIFQMGWLPLLFAIGLCIVGGAWYFYYAHGKVRRDGAIYHVFERLGRRRYEGLDTELRGILKEKGLREEDPFDEIVARAQVLDMPVRTDFESLAKQAAARLARRLKTDSAHMLERFMRGTRVGATPVSYGVALPHLRLPGTKAPEMVLVRVASGLHIDVMDGFGEAVPVEGSIRALFFLISAEENPGQHLRILAQLAGRVDDDDFMPAWLAAENDQELREALLRNENYLSLHVAPASKSETLIGKALKTLPFPRGCLVAIIRRGDATFVPGGNTILQGNDRLTIIGDPEGIEEIRGKCLT